MPADAALLPYHRPGRVRRRRVHGSGVMPPAGGRGPAVGPPASRGRRRRRAAARPAALPRRSRWPFRPRAPPRGAPPAPAVPFRAAAADDDGYRRGGGPRSRASGRPTRRGYEAPLARGLCVRRTPPQRVRPLVALGRGPTVPLRLRGQRTVPRLPGAAGRYVRDGCGDSCGKTEGAGS